MLCSVRTGHAYVDRAVSMTREVMTMDRISDRVVGSSAMQVLLPQSPSLSVRWETRLDSDQFVVAAEGMVEFPWYE